MTTADETWTKMRLQLRDERMRRGWSLTKLAQRIKRLPITIGSWERGDRHPSGRELMNWVAGLGLEIQLVPAGASGPVDPVAVAGLCERIEDLAYVAQLIRWGAAAHAHEQLEEAAA